MTEVSRTRRSAQNALVAGGSQIILIGLSFATRTAFIAQLGTEILGVHTLLVSLLAMVAVADLGINTAVMHSLYRPLQEQEYSRVSAIVNYASRLYKRVALVVALVGVATLPLLETLVKLDRGVPHLRVYFLILLVDAVAMYLMAHRAILVAADQRMYLIKMYTVAFSIAKGVAQIAVLVLWQSFVAFLIIQALFTILTNATIYLKAGRWYPYLRDATRLDGEDRRAIAASVRAMVVYRLGGIILHNSDPVLISIIVGTATLGLYSNYLLIAGSFIMLTEVAFQGIFPSVGNLIANKVKPVAHRVLEELTLLSTMVYGVGAVALFVGLDHFLRLWLGGEFVLGPGISAAVALNFYVVGVMAPIWAFRGATGMFRETQYVFLVTALLNLVLSVLLGHIFGLVGILIATAAARLLTGNWYEPWILLSRHLGGSTKMYLFRQLRSLALWVALAAFGLVVTGRQDGPALGVAVAYIAFLPFIAWLVYGRTIAFRSLVSRARSLL